MISGLILLNKEPGITSFDALRDIKRALGTGKVGHTGTLDKFAQGLLVILTGRALKLSRWFSHCDKKYTGRIHFGIETDTLDPEGEVIAQAEIPCREEVEKALKVFTGEIKQAPPAYSAIHINGKRASSLVRAGQAPEMKKRQVTVYKLELVSWQPPFAEIFVHCSSGTYIRSLARDIALAVNSRGYLDALTRTQVAGFELSHKMPHTKAQRHKEEINFIRPIDKEVVGFLGMPWFEVTPQEAKNIFHGKPLTPVFDNKQLFSPQTVHSIKAAAVFSGEELIAVVENDSGQWKYGCVLS